MTQDMGNTFWFLIPLEHLYRRAMGMPWKENQVVDLRLEFVMASFEKGINFTRALCRIWYIYKVWIQMEGKVFD